MNLFKFARDAGEAVRESVGGLAEGIKDRITGHKTDVKDLKVEHAGEKIVLNGTAKSQAEAEKAIIAAGNTPGTSGTASGVALFGKVKLDAFSPTSVAIACSRIARCRSRSAALARALCSAVSACKTSERATTPAS